MVFYTFLFATATLWEWLSRALSGGRSLRSWLADAASGRLAVGQSGILREIVLKVESFLATCATVV